jgi:hypothetical protein
VDGQDRRPLLLVGQRDLHRPVEAPGPQQRRVEDLGRLVAAMTTTLAPGSKPSMSDSSWLSVCSRSSLEPNPPGPRRPPMASISSMKMIDGARLRASANRSRTREAPTPTNISTKLEPLRAKNGTPASPATALASRVLPVPGGPTISTPFGPTAPARRSAAGASGSPRPP